MEANTQTTQPSAPIHPILAGLLGGAPTVPSVQSGSGEATDRETVDGQVEAPDATSPEPPKMIGENYRKRLETEAVKAYLNDLTDNSTTGHYSLPSLEARLAQVEKALEVQKDPLRRVYLAQKRIDLIKQIRKARKQAPIKEREAAFIEVVKPFSERKGYSYSAWRAVGVPAHVLKAGGVKASRVDSIDGRKPKSK